MKAKKIRRYKTKELRGTCNLLARCALIQGKRNIDMRVIIWTDRVSKEYIFLDGSLLDGSKSKSGAVTEILKATEVEPTDQIVNKLDCVWCYESAEYEMNTNLFKTDKELSNKFLHLIDYIPSGAGLQIVAFDT